MIICKQCIGKHQKMYVLSDKKEKHKVVILRALGSRKCSECKETRACFDVGIKKIKIDKT